ncbi:MAG: alpha-ketoglutarate-dependent dioxygenase AlkB [Pseudomonadota bacterium]
MAELFPSTDPERIELPDAELRFWPVCDLGVESGLLFDELHRELAWREESIFLFGRRVLQPRLLAWYGDEGTRYRYSGVVHEPEPLPARLHELRGRLEVLCETRFNSVLANLYRHERDSMGLHADDEPELGAEPVIASLSLGAERVFRLRHRRRRDLKPLRLTLPSGSLLVMSGTTQQFWKHEVPKQTRACGPRINLTFRRIFNPAP